MAHQAAPSCATRGTTVCCHGARRGTQLIVSNLPCVVGVSLVCAVAGSAACGNGLEPSGADDAGMYPSTREEAGVHSADAELPRVIPDADVAEGGDTGRAALSMAEAIEDYLRWKPLQSEPQAISVEIFALCRLPSRAETAFTESVHGQSFALRDWANEPAQRGLAASPGEAFPVDAAIVKQKWRGSGPSAQLAALGIMIKRGVGFDPARGDWEFGYWDEVDGLSAGEEAGRACGSCHATSKTDFVFADQSWRLEP